MCQCVCFDYSFFLYGYRKISGGYILYIALFTYVYIISLFLVPFLCSFHPLSQTVKSLECTLFSGLK